MSGFLVKQKVRKDMLNRGSRHYFLVCLFIILLLNISCTNSTKTNVSEQSKLFLKFSANVIGDAEYKKVYKNIYDTINVWSNCNPPLLRITSEPWKIDSLLCFNTSGDKMVTAFQYQNINIPTDHDGLLYFYGVKIKEEWYFFSGPSVHLPREYYQKDLHTPLSFEKLHEIAMKEIFGGYLKKNELGEWEINERFFDAFSNMCGAQFEERKTVSYRFFSCENIDNEKDFWDCNYRKHAERNWVKEKWFLVKDAPIYNSIDPLEVQWTLKKGTQVRVFEYVDGGIWCSMRAEGYMPNGLSDGKTRYVHRSDLTETDPHAPKVAKSSIKEAQRSP